jgi:hypothetical protein
MYSTDLQIKLNAIAYQYRDKIRSAVYQVLSQPRYKNTGAGLASLTVDVNDGNAQRSPSIVVSASDHVFRLGSRGLQWTSLPNMKKMMEWAEYKTGGDMKRAKALAWGTSKDKLKNDTWKPKAWRRQALSAVLKEMNAAMLIAFDRAIEEDLQKAATGKAA